MQFTRSKYPITSDGQEYQAVVKDGSFFLVGHLEGHIFTYEKPFPGIGVVTIDLSDAEEVSDLFLQLEESKRHRAKLENWREQGE